MKRLLTFLPLFVLIFFAAALPAQPLASEREQGHSISVEFLKPYFVDSNSSFTTSVLFLTGRLSLSQTIAIVADLPFAHHGYRDDFGRPELESTIVIGNPYLAIQIGRLASPLLAEIGLRLPLSSDRDEFYHPSMASSIGILIDPNRFEAFGLNDLSVVVRLNYLHEFSSDFRLLLHGGWSGGGSTDGEYGPSGFQTLDYGVQLGYLNRRVNVFGELSGRYLLDGSTPFLSGFHSSRGRTVNQVAVAANIGLGKVHPGLYFRVPIDDFLSDQIRFVLGLSMRIQLK